MNVVHHAIELNNMGVHFLSLGEAGKAAASFKASLVMLSGISGTSTSISTGSIPDARQGRRPSPFVRTEILEEGDARTQVCSNEAFLISMPVSPHGEQEEDLTYERLSIYCAAVVFNSAVSVEFRLTTGPRSEIGHQKACGLYNHCVQMIGNANVHFDCSEIANKAVHRLASNYYKLGDFPRVRDLFDALFQWKLGEMFANQEEISAAATA